MNGLKLQKLGKSPKKFRWISGNLHGENNDKPPSQYPFLAFLGLSRTPRC